MQFLFEWEETTYYSAEIEAESEAEARKKFDAGEYTAELNESIIEDETAFAVTELQAQLAGRVHEMCTFTPYPWIQKLSLTSAFYKSQRTC